ncbi:MAG: hypothetical protein QOH71_1715 [Blastocatellia bacterium]|jgi:hypothetical protein|nr:hypothetical protein [Blastocatellia bacterium]
MKKLFLTGCVSTKWLGLLLVLVLIGLVSVNAGCNLSQGPSKTVESLLRAVERGEIERAVTFFSGGITTKRGISLLKADLSTTSVELKADGGIKSIKVLKEDVVGEVAEVTIEITKGNGSIATLRYKLILERGTWKIDGVNTL